MSGGFDLTAFGRGRVVKGQERRSKRDRLPMLHELPIPRDVRPGRGWTTQMREMADHIGPYATLCIVARYGGEQVYVSRNPDASPFADVIDAKAAATLAKVYDGNRISVPVGRTAVDIARRAVVIAALRANRITGAEAQKIIGTSRTYISHLVNETNEGLELSKAEARARSLPAQRDLFAALTEN